MIQQTTIKKALRLSFLLVIALFSLNFSPTRAPNGGILSVVVNGITEAGGTVRVVIFNSENKFLERDGYVYKQSVVVGSQKSVKLDFQMPHGYYAVSAYHDLNDNRTMDRNGLGLPTEPYSLSNNPSVKWRKPTFNETKFAFNQANQTISLDLKQWKDR
jgi:uncharacterized protein (DUF2141 family)